TCARLRAELPEQQMLAERAEERAFVLPQVEARRKWRAADEHAAVPILPVLFVRSEHLHAVLHDGSADRQAGLEAFIGGFGIAALLGEVLVADERLVLILEEALSRPGVAAALGHGGDDGARRLFVLGLVVLRQHLEFLHGVLWKR